MKIAWTLFALTLFALGACRTSDPAPQKCPTSGQTCQDCGQQQTCPGAGEVDEVEAQVNEAFAETGECGGCWVIVSAKGTGWCEECGKGYKRGMEVKCTKACKSNPGGPPCSNCIK